VYGVGLNVFLAGYRNAASLRGAQPRGNSEVHFCKNLNIVPGALLNRPGYRGGWVELAAMRPVHPGEVLLEDYIKPMGTSVRAVAMALHAPYSRLNEIVKG
jgi:hypothetical protein